ncbi:hypothetical protein ES705_44745 [subsurface metagenome]
MWGFFIGEIMSLILSTRNQQINIINQNKASIIITRTAKVSDGAGGYVTTPTILDSQDIRIYSKRTRTLVIDEGGYHSIRVTLAIAKYDADILKKSATNEDKFIYDSKNYQIFDVIDRYVKSSIVFKELELEEI